MPTEGVDCGSSHHGEASWAGFGQALGKVRPAEALQGDSLGSVMPSCAVTCVMGPVCHRFGTGNTGSAVKKGLELSLRSMEPL